MRRIAGYTGTDHKTNIKIAKELNITLVLDKIQDYKRKWIQHVNRTPRKQITQIVKKLYPKKRKEPRKTIEETSGCV
jgi:hypothetical protein